MQRVKDKVAVVTGAASGLGKAIAACLQAEGAQVIITDVQTALGRETAAQLQCDFYQQDVSCEQQWLELIHYVESQYGALHIVVNNAGIEGRVIDRFEELSLSDWQQVQRINVEGTFLGCRAAIPLLRQSGGGAIVNISSIAAFASSHKIPAYGASKAAVRQLTQSIAISCAKDGSGIRCNSVHPGIIQTPMVQRLHDDLTAQTDSAEGALSLADKNLVPQGELQQPEDIAAAVLFLASDEAKRITGAQLTVDGGITIQG